MRLSARAALALAALGLASCGGTTAAVAGAAPGLTLGFSDDGSFVDPDATTIARASANAASAGASVIRFSLDWRRVAPDRPPGRREAQDPDWTGYRWDAADKSVRAIAAAGLQPLPVVGFAPAWAEGPGRPADEQTAPAGTWRPSAQAYGDFATALARRYSGSHRDPAGGTLPRVRQWQAWNEPNLTTFLTPQWRGTAGGFAPRSPDLYRALLNGFYRAVKRVDPSATVVTAGTAPYGDLHDGDRRMPPARFWRALLCVHGRTHPRAGRCPKVWFDALAHHPYPIGPPRRHARNADDVVIPDMGKITGPLSAARRAGTVLPRGPKQVWATEVSWDSRPDPDGLSLADQATYLEGALYVLWREGVDHVSWYIMRDQAPTPDWSTTYQSGIFFRGATIADDRPKPSFTAFRFPFTAYRTRGVARLWGRAPADGEVLVDERRGAGWTQVARVTARGGIFGGRLRVGRGTVLRARQGDATSLGWTVF